MKRFFILASAAIVALASCAKTEVVYNDAPQEIAFKQVTNVMTKATTETLNAGIDMGVFAWTNETTPQNYFGAAKRFANDGVIWKADPAQYYPLQTSLNFACYAPYSGLLEWSYDNGAQTLVSPAIENVKAIDVLYGDQIYADCDKSSSPVPVTFKHALAKVSVNVQTNVPRAINVTSVTLEKFDKGGTLTVDYNNNELVSAVWGLTTEPADYTWALTENMTAVDTPISCGTSLYFIASNYPITYVDAFKQTKFVVNYTMNGNTFTAKVDLDGYWEMGKHYTYTLKANLNEITFDPEVEVMEVVTPAPAL